MADFNRSSVQTISLPIDGSSEWKASLERAAAAPPSRSPTARLTPIDLGLARDHTIGFLRSIGLDIVIVDQAEGFLEGSLIVDGALLVAPNCSISDMLHECGHLACIPTLYRPRAQDNVENLIHEIYKEDDQLKGLHPDHPLSRALIQCGDPEATAWAYAAGKAIGLPDEVIIKDDEYSHQGGYIRDRLKSFSYVGIHGLKHAGMCNLPRKPYEPRKTPGYPTMKKWIQDVDYHTPVPDYIRQEIPLHSVSTMKL